MTRCVITLRVCMVVVVVMGRGVQDKDNSTVLCLASCGDKVPVRSRPVGSWCGSPTALGLGTQVWSGGIDANICM